MHVICMYTCVQTDFPTRRQACYTDCSNTCRSPYLLIASSNQIYRMHLNGSGTEVVVQDSNILAVDYHYRYV